MIAGYRIVEVKSGRVYSLFHGTNKSREIRLDEWNTADKKMVRDGRGNFTYESGWHFLPDRESCDRFLASKFRIKENRMVVPCYVDGNIRSKHPEGIKGTPCLLADKIYISSEAISGL